MAPSDARRHATGQPTGPAGRGATGALAAHREGAGPRVVLVHGFTQTAASWRRVVAALGDRYEVVTVDLPGHGASAACAVTSLSDAASLVGDAGGRACYVGYSLGGRCCLTLALEHPELVESLVLVGATAGILDEHERAARRAADDALADRLDAADGQPAGLEEFLRDWLAGPLFAHLDADQADVASRLANTPRGLAASLRTMGTGTQVPSYDRLAGLEMPVTLVTGAKDERFDALARHMAAAIGPNARHEVVPDVGHAVPFEAPDAFAALLGRCLASGP